MASGLPETRDFTATPQVSDLPAASVNRIQDALAMHTSIVRGLDFLLEDDFTGDSLDRGKWVNAVAAFPDLSAAGALGAIELINPNTTISNPLGMGTYDWVATFRARWPNYATAAAMDDKFGLGQITDLTKTCFFYVHRTAGATFNIGIVHANGATVDTGVAVNAASWKWFVIRKVGTKITYEIDGVVVYTVTNDTVVRDGNTVWLGVSGDNVASKAQFDFAKCHILRSAISSPPPSGSDAGHVEGGYSAITPGVGNAHEYLDVAWGNPFPAATGADAYNVEVQISLTTATDPIIGWNIVNKTTAGFRIKFSADFNGEVRWKAFK